MSKLVNATFYSGGWSVSEVDRCIAIAMSWWSRSPNQLSSHHHSVDEKAIQVWEHHPEKQTAASSSGCWSGDADSEARLGEIHGSLPTFRSWIDVNPRSPCSTTYYTQSHPFMKGFFPPQVIIRCGSHPC